MANIDPTVCREWLHKDFVQNRLKDGNIPVVFIAKCVEEGVIDCHDDVIILALEQSLGTRINPKVAPTIKAGFAGAAARSGKTGSDTGGFGGMRRKQSPVMGSAIPPCLKEIPGQEMFRALVTEPSYAVDRLRAAMYPATMSYCERMFEENGRTYMVPYVTVMEDFDQDGNTRFVKGEDYYKGGSYDEGKADATYEGRMAVSTTFYLDRNGNVSSMNGNYIHLFSVKDFESPKAISAYMQELTKAYSDHWSGCVSASKKKYKEEGQRRERLVQGA